ncbi:MAG: hypothetical protein H7249_17950 [Chitinophagaceae bacterium]|nr:hypothetical protein [Oligoflexus sp.]
MIRKVWTLSCAAIFLSSSIGALSLNAKIAKEKNAKTELFRSKNNYFHFDRVEFKSSDSILTPEEITRLVAYSRQAHFDSHSSQILVVSWSDKDIPDEGNLTAVEKELAHSRSEHIIKVLKESGASSVDSIEMTSQPLWLEKFFATESAQAKIAGFGGRLKANKDDIGTRLKLEGGPRRSVIVTRTPQK